MRISVAVFFVVTAIPILPTELSATAQSGDVLIVGDDKHSIHTFPLEAFFRDHPELRPDSDIMSTNLYRGYVATWALRDGRLFLEDIEMLRRKKGSTYLETEFHSVMSQVFPGVPEVSADWYSGYVIIPIGDLIEYVHNGCASTFDRYLRYTIIDGAQTSEITMTADEYRHFRDKQFQAYRETPEYAAEVSNLMEDTKTKPVPADFLYDSDSCLYTSMLFTND